MTDTTDTTRTWSTQHKHTGPGIGYVSELAYPMKAPYQMADDPDRLYGRPARLLSIIFTTLINTDDPCYHPGTRTLWLNGRFAALCKKFGLSNGGNSRTLFGHTMHAYSIAAFDLPDGRQVKAVESCDLTPRLMRERTIVFTKDFVSMMRTRPRPISLDMLSSSRSSTMTLDLLVMCALYTPDTRRMIVPMTQLERLFPRSRSIRQDLLERSVRQANAAQSDWHLRLKGMDSVSVTPTGCTNPTRNPMRLEAVGNPSPKPCSVSAADTNPAPNPVRRRDEWDTGLVSELAYPMKAPYRSGGDKERLSGRQARLLSIVFTTLVNDGGMTYDEKTRTLRFGREFTDVCRKLKLLVGGATRRFLMDAMHAYTHAEFTDASGAKVRAVEDSCLDARLMKDRWLRFTPDYVGLMRERPRRISIDALSRTRSSSLLVDLLVACALYAPDDRPMLLPRDEMPRLMPSGSWSYRSNVLSAAADEANAVQTRWHLASTGKGILVTPTGGDTSGVDVLVLRVPSSDDGGESTAS